MSTAPHLSEKNNNLFRFCLNDEKQALALVHLAKEMNINSVVLVYRNDIYGNNLKSLVLKYGEKLDMDIDQEVQYDTNETNYANIVSSIEEKVRIEKSENPPDKVAVLLISFNEAHDIFKAAEGNAELESTRWIGCDGIEANAAVFKEKNTLNFARNTGLIICNFGADMNEYYRDIPEKLKQKTGLDKVPVTALFYYDIMLVLTRSWLTVAKPDFDMFSKSIPVVSNTSTFVTDDMGMNEHGDRKWGVYDFWQIKNETFGKNASIGYGDWAPEGGFEWYLSK
jgi:branched-chain amino acid transport system substrate-binding protein